MRFANTRFFQITFLTRHAQRFNTKKLYYTQFIYTYIINHNPNR